jgi:uncharacterized protein involved in exopolysaccharide biosynthesis
VQQALLASLEARLQDASNARRAAEVKAAADQNASSTANSLTVQGLRTQLDTQQAQLAQLRVTYGAQHPKVLELENQIRATQRNLDNEQRNVFASGSHAATIGIVSNAIPPQKAAKPNKTKLVAIGMILGILIGLIAPLLYELLVNRRIRCRDDFERDMQLPVLMEFDAIAAAEGAT